MKKIVLNTIAAIAALGYINTVSATEQEIELDLDLHNQPAQMHLDYFKDLATGMKSYILQNAYTIDRNTASNLYHGMKKIAWNTIDAILALGYANTVSTTPSFFNDLPTEMITRILQHVHVNDLKAASNVCHGWRNIIDERNFWIQTTQKINPLIDHNISNKALGFLKRFLEDGPQITFLNSETGGRDIAIIGNNGTAIRWTDIRIETSVSFLQGSEGMEITQFSSADDSVQGGTTRVNGQRRAYITTDFKTMKLLPIPNNATETVLSAISDDGLKATGTGNFSEKTRGLYWSKKAETTDVQLLESEWDADTSSQCMSRDGWVSGGWAKRSPVINKSATLWLDNKYSFIYSVWLNAIKRPHTAKLFDIYTDVVGISPNGDAQHGTYGNDGRCDCWLMFVPQ